MAAVPCNGCTACCVDDAVVLTRHDDRDAYAWHLEPAAKFIPGAAASHSVAVLDRRADGSCVYRGASGCEIHGRAPVRCQRFDCRALAARTSSEQRIRWIARNPAMRAVFEAADQRAAVAA